MSAISEHSGDHEDRKHKNVGRNDGPRTYGESVDWTSEGMKDFLGSSMAGSETSDRPATTSQAVKADPSVFVASSRVESSIVLELLNQWTNVTITDYS